MKLIFFFYFDFTYEYYSLSNNKKITSCNNFMENLHIQTLSNGSVTFVTIHLKIGQQLMAVRSLCKSDILHKYTNRWIFVLIKI